MHVERIGRGLSSGARVLATVWIGLVGFLVAFGLPAFALDCDPDFWEPDDTCTAAASVIHGFETQQHDFCDDDEDWISFNACTGREYTIYTSHLGTAADTVLELYDSDCQTLLAIDDDGGDGAASRIEWITPIGFTEKGTFHLRVRQADATTGADREYKVSVSGQTTACSIWSRETEASLKLIRPLPDGGYIARTSSPYALLKLDPQGNVVWAKSYSPAVVSDVVVTSDGGFAAAAGSASLGLIVAKLFADGSVQWARVHDIPESPPDAVFVRAMPDGGVLAVASDRFTLRTETTWVFRHDSQGDVLWRKEFTTPSTTVGELIDVVISSDGGAILVADANFFGSLIRLDGSGSTVWAKSYWPDNINYLNINPSAALTTRDGRIFVVGTVWRLVDDWTYPDVWTLYLESDGSVLWSKTWGGTTSSESANDVTLVPDGDFLVAGYTCQFMKVDPTGSLEWSKDGQGGCDAIEPVADGSLIVFNDPFPDDVIHKIAPHATGGQACLGFTDLPLPLFETSFGSGDWSLPTEDSLVSSSPILVSTNSESIELTLECTDELPTPPEEVSPPGSGAPLRFLSASELEWEEASVSGSETFNLYRGDLGSLSLGDFGACLEQGLSSSSTVDSDEPLWGQGFAYVVTGANAGGESTMGTDWAGGFRPNVHPCQ